MPLSKRKYDTVIPEPDSVLQSLRAFGYSIETAIADLIDNSITANADTVRITFGIEKFNAFVRIEDNGKGMNEKQLVNAMRIGSFNPLISRGENDLGRFGLGLKTASFSQCKRLSVRTKKNSAKIYTRVWDLDIIHKEQKWILLKEAVTRQSEKNLSDITAEKSGTVVLWENLDRLIESGDFSLDKQNLKRKIENLRVHLGLIFHRFLEESIISIFVGDRQVDPINPFFISEKQPTRELGAETHSIHSSEILIQPFILPHESKLTQKEIEKLHIIKGWNEHQGIYLYRNKRLISEGTWLDLPFRKKESQRLARIQIDLPNTLDKEWQIDVKKASAKVPDVMRNQVKRICTTTILEAIKVYTHRGAYVRRKGEKKEIVYLWIGKQRHGKKFYHLNEKHPFYELIVDLLGDSKRIFHDYIRLAGDAIPINMIVNDFSDPRIVLHTQFEENKKNLHKVYENALQTLIGNGISKTAATDLMKNLDIFQTLQLQQ